MAPDDTVYKTLQGLVQNITSSPLLEQSGKLVDAVDTYFELTPLEHEFAGGLSATRKVGGPVRHSLRLEQGLGPLWS